MSDKPKRYSLENPQMQEMWKKKIRVNLKDRNIIKRILKEETDKEKRFKDMVLNHMLKNYSENRYDTKPTDPRVFESWANNYVKRDLEEKYGITEKNHPEIYHYIMDEYYHRVTGLLKKGTRVRLIFMNDKYTKLKKGDEGTIVGYSHTPWGTDYLVRWDTGSTLNLVPKEDKFEVLS